MLEAYTHRHMLCTIGSFAYPQCGRLSHHLLLLSPQVNTIFSSEVQYVTIFMAASVPPVSFTHQLGCSTICISSQHKAGYAHEVPAMLQVCSNKHTAMC